MIDLPTPELSAEWTQVDQRIHVIVGAIEEEADFYGLPVRVTSLLREGNPHSPHHYGRACDISVCGWPPELVGAALRLARFYPYPRNGFSTIALESPRRADLAPYEAEYPPPLTLFSSAASAVHLHVQVPVDPTPEWETLPDEAYTVLEDRVKHMNRERLLSSSPIKPERAEGNAMQHPERLGWAKDLPEGYYLDELGQVRHQATADLVCGWSGRGHRHYLLPLPCPEPVSGAILRVWVDRQSMQDFGRAVRADGEQGASRGLQGFARRLLGEAVSLLLDKVIQ